MNALYWKKIAIINYFKLKVQENNFMMLIAISKIYTRPDFNFKLEEL